MIYLELFWTYLKIGFFGFGGGYGMLSLIQNEVVVQNGWLTNAELSDIIAISQMTPGPIAINSATYVGYKVAGGVWGAVVATLAVSMPALTIMLLLTKFYMKLRNNHYLTTTMFVLKPVIIGMIGSAALLLIFPHSDDGCTFIDLWSWGLFGATLIASWHKVNPILLIVLSAVAGI